MAMDPYEYFYDDLVYSYDNTWNGLPVGTALTDLYQHTFQTDDHAVMDLPAALATERHDSDFRFVQLVAGRTYRFIASPSSTVAGADPVLYLYDPANMTTDPPEVLRRCDDYSWGTGTKLGACFYYSASTTGQYYFSIDDELGSGYVGTKWVKANYTRGPTYDVQVIDEGARALPIKTQWTAATGPTPFASDRYWLAAGMAYYFKGDATFSGVTDVIIASGRDQAAADPLSASGLAGVYDAPLLLVRGDWPSTLPPGTAWALSQMKTDNPGVSLKFHIVGGPASVPETLKAKIRALSTTGSTIDRIGGADRYEVAAGVAARMRAVQGTAYERTAFFVNGRDAAYFWNALMCGPVAFRLHWPILLVQKNAVPAKTAAAKGFYTTRYVVGTKTDVYDSTLTSIKSGGSGMRIAPIAKAGAGYNRQAMSRQFAETAQNDGWLGGNEYIEQLGVTNKLADSLAGGILMGKRNGAIVFTRDQYDLDPASGSYMSEYVQYRRLQVEHVWFFGGLASVTPDLSNRVMALLGAGD